MKIYQDYFLQWCDADAVLLWEHKCACVGLINQLKDLTKWEGKSIDREPLAIEVVVTMAAAATSTAINATLNKQPVMRMHFHEEK